MMQDLLGALTLASIYLIFALGMSLVWGTVNVLNFAHGSTFMFAAFVTHLITTKVALPLPGLLAVGIAVGAAVAIVTQVLVFRPIMSRATDEHSAHIQVLIGGIGMATIPLAIAQHVTLNNPFGFQGSSFRAQAWQVLGVRLTSVTVVIIVTAVVLAVAIGTWIRLSRHGLALRGIGIDPPTAALMGANRSRLELLTMAVAGATAGLAGILYTLNLGAMIPVTGDALLLKAFAVIILGGVGSVAGAVVGSIILAGAETLVLTQTSGLWVDAVAFGVIFLMLLARPNGLFGHAEVRRT